MYRSLILFKKPRSFADLVAFDDKHAGNSIRLVLRPRLTVRIDAHTSKFATIIIGAHFFLYSLERKQSKRSYAALQPTIHYFDAPGCLELLTTCNDVVAIQGCKADGEDVLVDGLNNELAAEVGAAMTRSGLECILDAHEFAGTHTYNICNRGCPGVGAQLELSAAVRKSSSHKRKLVAAVRYVMLQHVARRMQPRAARPSV